MMTSRRAFVHQFADEATTRGLRRNDFGRLEDNITIALLILLTVRPLIKDSKTASRLP